MNELNTSFELAEQQTLHPSSSHSSADFAREGLKNTFNADAGRRTADDAKYKSNGTLPTDFELVGTAPNNSDNRNYRLYEQPARQAQMPLPELNDIAKSGVYDAPIKLNIQITPAPEITQSVDASQLLHYFEKVSEVGVAGVRPIEKHLAEPNAVNKDLLIAGKTLVEIMDTVAHNPGKVAESGQNAFRWAKARTEQIVDTLSKPMTIDQRAELAGAVLPMFFLEGKKLDYDAVDAMGLEKLQKAELDKLGIVKQMNCAGGDWPFVNERPSPDVVQQIHSGSCVAACGEMLTEGAVKQEDLIARLLKHLDPQIIKPNQWSTFAHLVDELKDFEYKVVIEPEDAPGKFDEYCKVGKPWVIDLQGHAVIIDGKTETGLYTIRDPWKGYKYEMTRESLLKFWNGLSVNPK
jgi:hypothetical protein